MSVPARVASLEGTAERGLDGIARLVRRGRPLGLDAQDRLWSLLLSLPMTLFLFIFFIVPFAFIVLFAVDYYNDYYQVAGTLGLDNFRAVWIPSTATLFGKTALAAGTATAFCFVLAYPAAYYIAWQPARRRELLVMLLIIPFWTSFLLRTYSLMTIFGENGLANQALAYFGLPAVFEVRNLWSVIWAETYTFMPFMVLPLYATLERMNRSAIEASYVLGAGPVRTFLRIILPLSVPGILAGSLLVFIIAMGELVIPALVGGVDGGYLLGNAIDETHSQLPGFASALGVLFMLIVFAVSIAYIRFVGRGGLRL